jgi:hypothetical protein
MQVDNDPDAVPARPRHERPQILQPFAVPLAALRLPMAACRSRSVQSPGFLAGSYRPGIGNSPLLTFAQ